MSAYIAPLQDMQFVIRELVGLDEIPELPGCEEVTGDLVDAVLDEAAKFAADVLDPLNTPATPGLQVQGPCRDDPDGFKQAYRRFIAGGWTMLACDPDYGGQGLPQVVATPVEEMWHAANMAFALCPMLTRVHRSNSPPRQR